MKIRKARPEDYRRIASLRKKTFEKINGKNYSKKRIEIMNKLNPPGLILEKIKKREMFCLVGDNKILGVIDLEGNKIGGLFIRYGYVNRGLGKKLMKFMEDYAKKKDLRKVKLYSTKYAFQFYLKLGYKLIEKGKWKPEGISFTTYEMEKKLK